MDKEIKAKWIKALRSGRYKQTKGRLQSADGKRYCCLGVLEHCVLKVPYGPEYRQRIRATQLPGNVLNLPDETLTKCGLTKADMDNHQLWKKNDEDGKSFEEIADYIESNL